MLDKQVLLSIILVLFGSCWWTTYVNCIQIDNRLVAAQHGEYEKVYGMKKTAKIIDCSTKILSEST